MSIQSFLDSALVLYNNDKYSEALCLTCSAVDACSKTKYPKKDVSSRFKLFLKDNFMKICEFGLPGIRATSISINIKGMSLKNLKVAEEGVATMEEIIYYALRCSLVHECQVENYIEFSETTHIGCGNNNKFYIPKTLILGLMEVAKQTRA